MQGDLEVLETARKYIHRHQEQRVRYHHAPERLGDDERVEREVGQQGPERQRHVQLPTPVRPQDPAVQEPLRGVELLYGPFFV